MGLRRVPQALPGSLPRHKGLLPARAQLFGIYRQMCRHGNPSQALNLPPCRGMLSLLAAVFPPSTSLPELEEWDVPCRAGGRRGKAWDSSGGIFLPKVLGDVFQVLVPRQEWYRHPAEQTDASLQRGAQLLNCAPWSGVSPQALQEGNLASHCLFWILCSKEGFSQQCCWRATF